MYSVHLRLRRPLRGLGVRLRLGISERRGDCHLIVRAERSVWMASCCEIYAPAYLPMYDPTDRAHWLADFLQPDRTAES